jgi:hypothetical protein
MNDSARSVWLEYDSSAAELFVIGCIAAADAYPYVSRNVHRNEKYLKETLQV